MIEYENLKKFNLPFFDEYKEVFYEVLDSGWYILGENVKKFEEEFARYNSSGHCVGVASGLDAIILSLQACCFGKLSEVIVPSNTYIATIIAILRNDLKPVLVECDINTYNIDPRKIEEKITSRTKAIIPVHLYGKSCDMYPILEIARKNKLIVIEDCAQSHGAKYKDKKVGSFGDFGAFSFYPTKNLGALGDGGAISISDSQFDSLLRTIRNYGSGKKYNFDEIGMNSRLDEIQAAFLLIKLKHLDEINEHKRKLAKIYLENLKSDFIVPVVDPDCYDVYHIFAVRHPRRDDLRSYLLENGVKSDIHYPVSPNMQKSMIGILDDQRTPISEEIHNTILSLPISYCHNFDDIYRVVEVMNDF